MNQSKPRSQTFDGVCISAPSAHGYSVVPPPPTTSATRNGGTAHLAAESSVDQERQCYTWTELICAICFTLIMLRGVVWYESYDQYPGVKVESVSVSLDNIGSDDSHVVRAAEWNLGFSIDHSHSKMSYDNNGLKDMYVWLTCAPRNSSGTYIRTFSRHGKYSIRFGASVNTLLPGQYYTRAELTRGLTLEFEAMLHMWYDTHRLEVKCQNMTIAFLPNATEGIMKGGPRLCGAITSVELY